MAQWQGLGRYPENADPKDCPAAGELLAYVDGSYQDALKKYGFGCIFILPDGRIYTEYGNGDNPDSLKQRNVSGEMLGAMYAVRFALNSGFRAIEIRYDHFLPGQSLLRQERPVPGQARCLHRQLQTRRGFRSL